MAEVSASAGIRSRAVAAYGGADVWRRADTVVADLEVGGLLFRWKRLRRLPRMTVRAQVHEPLVRLEPIDHQGRTGVLDGPDVRLLAAGDAVVAERRQARDAFGHRRRTLHWDALDLTYFLGYAMWNYLTLPALLTREDITWREDSAGRLVATFPPQVPTHCRRQVFHLDPASGRLARLDYTAEVFGGWAHAAHLIQAHDRCDGIPYASRRRVVPRVGTHPIAAVPLIWARVGRARLLPATG